MYRVLMIDDEQVLLKARSSLLEQQGCKTDTADSMAAAAVLLDCNRYDLVLLDVKMPERSGFDLYQDISELTDAPIVFLSSVSDTDYQLRGFETGAADYITKDCPPELFLAKVFARMELYRKSSMQHTRCFPPLVIDMHKRLVTLDGQPLALTNIEFNLLALLSSRPEKTWTVSEIFRSQWGGFGEIDNQLVQAHISHLRRKLQSAYPLHDYIETVWGRGYVFVPPIGGSNF